MRISRRRLGAPLAALFALGLGACGSTADIGSSAQDAAASTNPAAPAGSTPALTVYIFRGVEQVKGPDGKGHDAFVPSSFVMKQGGPTTITFINEDEGPHTITSPELGVNIMVNPGHENADKSVTPVSTMATITPTKTGVFHWYCAIPCDSGQGGWAMKADWNGPGMMGYMAGYIVVV